MISSSAGACPSCACPVEQPASERVKDLLLVLFIIAVVSVSGWVIIDQTIGREGAARMFATLFHKQMLVHDETVSVPTDEFRGVLVSLPDSGEVVIDVDSLGGKPIDVHVITAADLLKLANTKPPFAARKVNDFPAFEAKAATNAKRNGKLGAGSYVVLLEHSERGTPPSDARVIVRLTP